MGGVGNWFGEQVGRVGARERGACCWGFGERVGQGRRVGEVEQVCGLTTCFGNILRGRRRLRISVTVAVSTEM